MQEQHLWVLARNNRRLVLEHMRVVRRRFYLVVLIASVGTMLLSVLLFTLQTALLAADTIPIRPDWLLGWLVELLLFSGGLFSLSWSLRALKRCAEEAMPAAPKE